MKGIVTKTTGNNYIVECNGVQINCKIKGTFKTKGIDSTNPLAVGDSVEFELVSGHETGLIHTIHERKNYIIRKSVKLSKQSQILACNLDAAALVITPAMPRTSTGFIDRFIATAEAYHIPVILIFNKSDLFETDEYKTLSDQLTAIYKNLNYQSIHVSASSGKNMQLLQEIFKNKVTLIAGHSGTGKTSILNAMEPSLRLKTNIISVQHQKGMHTTTFAEMFKLSIGGFIIDSPGIGEFGTVDFIKTEISHYFVEMLPFIQLCKFKNCLHESETQCAVKSAVEKGFIHPSRYYNYLSILHNEDIFK